jgi:hypothetical protein
VREKLVDDEILDEQLDTLSPDEFVQAVCRKIGRPPPSIPLPRVWDDTAEATDAPLAETYAPAEAWSRPMDESTTGRPLRTPWKPDSS